jgi:hypothetical protein
MPNICGWSVWNLFNISLPVPRILKLRLDFVQFVNLCLLPKRKKCIYLESCRKLRKSLVTIAGRKDTNWFLDLPNAKLHSTAMFDNFMTSNGQQSVGLLNVRPIRGSEIWTFYNKNWCRFLSEDTVCSGRWLPMIWRKLLPPASFLGPEIVVGTFSERQETINKTTACHNREGRN